MTNCPVCGSASRSTGIAVETTSRFDIWRCPVCRLAFAAPRPSVADLAAFYSESYFRRPEGAVVGYADYEGESWAVANAQRMWEQLRLWEPELERIEPKVVLDVGCATGEFAASLAESGWTARGVELADSARARAVANGVEAVRTLDQAAAGNGLVTMFHVLEHVLEPLSTLAEARERVAPDGRLVVEVPQWRSIGRLTRRGRWSALTPPEHLNFFDRRAMAFALERTGWAVERSATLHPKGIDQAVEAVRLRRPWSAARYAAITAVLERTGVAGYLRVIARPV